MTTGYDIALNEFKKRGFGYPSTMFVFKIKNKWPGDDTDTEITYEYAEYTGMVAYDKELFWFNDWWEGQEVEILDIYDINRMIDPSVSEYYFKYKK